MYQPNKHSRLRSGLQRDASHRDFPLHKGGRRLVVDRGQCGDVADELVQQGRLQQVCLLRDGRLLGQNNILGQNVCAWALEEAVTFMNNLEKRSSLSPCSSDTQASKLHFTRIAVD